METIFTTEQLKPGFDNYIYTHSLIIKDPYQKFLKKQKKWDIRYIHLAKFVASWSKDPSTQTGAVITRPNNSVVSVGFNGMPIGVDDTNERLNNRELKYQMIVHCERNALLFAKQDVSGCTLYTYPFISCSVCAGMVINAGIKRCVAPAATEEQLARWGKAFELSKEMFKEAGVELMEYSHEELV